MTTQNPDLAFDPRPSMQRVLLACLPGGVKGASQLARRRANGCERVGRRASAGQLRHDHHAEGDEQQESRDDAEPLGPHLLAQSPFENQGRALPPRLHVRAPTLSSDGPAASRKSWESEGRSNPKSRTRPAARAASRT